MCDKHCCQRETPYEMIRRAKARNSWVTWVEYFLGILFVTWVTYAILRTIFDVISVISFFYSYLLP